MHTEQVPCIMQTNSSMHDSPTSSFDTRGLKFAGKFLLVCILVFSAVRFGTVFAADSIVAAGMGGIASIELKLAEVKAMRKMRSLGELNLLKQLTVYEEKLATRSIGTASVDTIAATHERMIAADLTEMKLYLFENGRATSTIDILSKGKRGSRWETPTGLYEIETKELTHFSSIGQVDMPYSMQFFGNFFIHGWPTYPDGTPVPEGYSGGCIRLSTEDARKVFEFAQGDTPIFISEGDSASSTPIVIMNKSVPKVSAKAFIVADIKSGTVFAEKDADTQYPIASLSKLLTALVANETIHYDRTLAITQDDRRQTEGTPGSLSPGESFTIGDLLFSLLMESNNSVAFALARYNGEEQFVAWMNDKARAIGMGSTRMKDPSGLTPENVSTASDLFKLTKYIHDSQSYILNISREPQKTITAVDGTKYPLANFNVFAENPQFLGGKTGYTDEAHETMTAVFELPVDTTTATINIVVLGSEDREKDIKALLAWFKSAATVASISQE